MIKFIKRWLQKRRIRKEYTKEKYPGLFPPFKLNAYYDPSILEEIKKEIIANIKKAQEQVCADEKLKAVSVINETLPSRTRQATQGKP